MTFFEVHKKRTSTCGRASTAQSAYRPAKCIVAPNHRGKHSVGRETLSGDDTR